MGIRGRNGALRLALQHGAVLGAAPAAARARCLIGQMMLQFDVIAESMVGAMGNPDLHPPFDR